MVTGALAASGAAGVVGLRPTYILIGALTALLGVAIGTALLRRP